MLWIRLVQENELLPETHRVFLEGFEDQRSAFEGEFVGHHFEIAVDIFLHLVGCWEHHSFLEAHVFACAVALRGGGE